MPPGAPASTRATRSRFSSPLHSGAPVAADAPTSGGSSNTRQTGSASTPRSRNAANSSRDAGLNAQKDYMARWLEPPVQSKSSFEEAGFQRHGVFEGMAPLGTLPKAVNVAKRISGLPEEKMFHESSPQSRQAAKQQQKRKELPGPPNRRAEQQRQSADIADDVADDVDAVPEEPPSEQVEPQDQQATEDAEPQQQTPSALNSKKIILKRPSAAKHVPTRIVVGPKRSTRAAAEAEAEAASSATEDMKKESGPNTPTSPITPTTPSTRRSIIFRPAPSSSKRQSRVSARQQEKQRQKSQEAMEEEADDADQSDQETGGVPNPVSNIIDVDAHESADPENEKPALQKPKPGKRPVGRPKSRRSLAAEQKAQKEKEQAEAEAEAERIVAAEAEAQIEAEAPSSTIPAPPSAPTALERPGRVSIDETDEEIRDSDGDSFDSQAEDGDGYGGRLDGFDSSSLPLKTPYGIHRPRSDSNATEVNREVTDKVVDLAVQEAVRHYRYPTAWALRTLYDEQAGDQSFLTMVEDVFQQTATAETISAFARMVHEKKKEGRKDKKACNYFVPPGTDNDAAPPQPIPAPYGNLITMKFPQFTTDKSGNIADKEADDTQHARKRVKLTDDDSEQMQSATPSAPVAMHTFAPPPTFVSVDAGNRETDHSNSTSRKSSVKATTPFEASKPTRTPVPSSAPPKTPTKSGRRPPGRPLGSKNKTLAEKAAILQRKQSLSGPTSAAAQGDDDAVMATPPPATESNNDAVVLSTPQTGRRHIRADSAASTLSPALSLSPPSRLSRRREVDEASDKDDDLIMQDASGNAITSVGWTADTVKRTTEKDDAHGLEKEGGNVNDDSKASFSSQQSSKRGGGGGADRRRGGPGSGRGGRRRGAGRPPKNRTLTGVPPAPKSSPATKTQAPEQPAPTPAPAPEIAQQPIATRNRSSAKKSPTPTPALISPLSSSSQTQSHTHTHTTGSQNKTHNNLHKRSSAAAAAAAISASAKDEMPAAVEDNISVRSVSVAKRAQNGAGKNRSSTAALPSPAFNGTDTAPKSLGKSESDEAGVERLSRLRREARGVTNIVSNAPESFTRGDAAQTPADAATSSERPASASRSRWGSVPDTSSRQPVLETPQPQRQRQLRASTTATRTTRSARKRAFDELDDDLSPRSGSFPADDMPSTRLQTPVPTQQVAATNASNANSRAGTPGPKSKKPRVGLRVKSSPVKKKTGTSAGLPRASGERSSPVANGAPNSQDDNDDYCASCGGSGDLVCCDGCTRSFHFNCVDPPVHEDRDLPDEWFCNVCIGRRNPASLVRYTGIFGALLNIMEKRNSSAFSLPSETRGYFEGVKTGADGEYEDIVVTGTSRTRKRGYDEAPDFFRIRDNDGNPVLCHTCNRSAEDNRPIIPCAYCGLWWHIDCLDPPMANPPVLRNWRCPAHTDDILAKLPNQLGPAHRFRKIKGAPAIRPAYSRGMINNGFIEFTSDDDSDNNSGWKDWQSFGRVQRISARGVELDFLQEIRREQNPGKRRRERMQRNQQRPEFRQDDEAPVRAEPVAIQPVHSHDVLLDRRFIDEAQAAHGLSALCTAGEMQDRSGELINALLSQADAPMVAMMAQGNALNIEAGTALTQADLAALHAMRARIDMLLSNPQLAISQVQPKEEQTAEAQQSIVSKIPESNAMAASEVPEVTMQDAADGDETHNEAVPETNEVMSLVSDNGENEDEDPPTITTPLNASEEEPGSAVWPVDHSVSDPGSANGALPASAKADLAEGELNGFRLCDHNAAKGPPASDSVPDPAPEQPAEAVEITTETADDAKKDDSHTGDTTIKDDSHTGDTTIKDISSPLAPAPASSQTAVGEEDNNNKENEAISAQLDKQSEQPDAAALETSDAQPAEANESAEK